MWRTTSKSLLKHTKHTREIFFRTSCDILGNYFHEVKKFCFDSVERSWRTGDENRCSDLFSFVLCLWHFLSLHGHFSNFSMLAPIQNSCSLFTVERHLSCLQQNTITLTKVWYRFFNEIPVPALSFPGRVKRFCYPPKRPDRLWGPHSLFVKRFIAQTVCTRINYKIVPLNKLNKYLHSGTSGTE